MSVRVYQSFESLPEGYDGLFAESGRHSHYLSREWFELIFSACARDGDELRIYGYEEDGIPVAAVPAWCTESLTDLAAGRTLSSLSNWYSGIYRPLIAERAGADGRILGAIVDEILDERPRWDSLHMMPLEADGPAYHGLIDAFRGSGLMPHSYYVSADWYEPFEGASFDDYWRVLSSKKRNTLRRKEKRAETEGHLELVLHTDASDIERGIADYERIYAASWKEPEQFAAFVPALIRRSAESGLLRLGLVYIDGVPAASELCIVAARAALMMKTAYDPRYRDLSVGALATLKVLRYVLDNDEIDEIDFGNGEDPYKREWVTQRRERLGVVGFNPRTVRGVLGAARNIGGSSLKSRLRGMFTGADAAAPAARRGEMPRNPGGLEPRR